MAWLFEPVEGDEGDYREAFARKPKLRERVWLPKERRAERCARCGLKKTHIVTLAMGGEEFGLCERCCEALWNLCWHDEPA